MAVDLILRGRGRSQDAVPPQKGVFLFERVLLHNGQNFNEVSGSEGYTGTFGILVNCFSHFKLFEVKNYF